MVIHHLVSPENRPELAKIHGDAPVTGAIFVSTIVLLYLVGLGLIAVHYMNASYGRWSWTLDDLWEEIRPTASACCRKQQQEEQTDNGKANPSDGPVNRACLANQ